MGHRYFSSSRNKKLFGLFFPEMRLLLEYRPTPKAGGTTNEVTPPEVAMAS